ncbi:NtaA/DmoA family FMN-dependent monooxygenase [Demequina sp. NBRC 110057]|uniref:NtaA/DmoA family FMN-dependent monooxygenase n=1 Tax=Demequina sp. NBRC 110057 TaxID=1570346 RepID=UPI00190EC1E9|nr:NtaA/DmoA family FMN-dependent monooxygenase [Demequina sp. NBRC 110057]
MPPAAASPAASPNAVPTRPLVIGLSLSPTWVRAAAWRRPDSRIEEAFGLDFSVDAARRAEAAHLDFVFKPDALTLDPTVLATALGFATLDPTVLLSAVASHTERIGLISTASATFAPPYLVAREIQSLDRVSRGRAGLNVVMSLGGQENFGLAQMPPSDERFTAAHAWLDDVRALWSSFPGEALVLDREAGRFADVERIRALPDLPGRPRGPLDVPGHPGARIPILQAGGSPAGKDFAAQHADAVFAAAATQASAAGQREDLRGRAEAHGRSPGGVRLLSGLSMFLARTRDEAFALHAESIDGSDLPQSLVGLSRLVGIDLAALPLDEPIPAALAAGLAREEAPVSAIAALIDAGITPRALTRHPEGAASLHWTIIGTPADAVAQIVARARAGAMDGFIALPSGSWESLALFLDEVVPALVDEGLFRERYETATLAGHLGIGPVPAVDSVS